MDQIGFSSARWVYRLGRALDPYNNRSSGRIDLYIFEGPKPNLVYIGLVGAET